MKHLECRDDSPGGLLRVWAASLCLLYRHEVSMLVPAPLIVPSLNPSRTMVTGWSLFPSCLRKHFIGKNRYSSWVFLKHVFEHIIPAQST